MGETLLALQALNIIDMDAGTVFSNTPSGRMIKGYDEPNSFTPKINSNYLFHEHCTDIVVWFIDPSDPLYVYGPSGCGKTSAIKQLAARINYPVFEVTGHSRLEFSTRKI